jgi:8-oxo-dGTP pyrophosphatase MutT (NUDIX family)
MLTNWTTERSQYLYKDRYLNHRIDRCRTPEGVVVDPYHVIEYRDWINVVAVTPDLDLLLVREYRHAGGFVATGLPSGTFEDGDDALSCAQRELREETGGVSSHWFATTTVFANHAVMTNRVHSFLAINVALEADTDFDESEEIETVPMPVTAVYQDLLSGRVLVQGLHLASLYAAAAFVRGLSDPLLTPFRDAIERAYKAR